MRWSPPLTCWYLLCAAGLVWAQPAAEYKPERGQEGRDVMWVPTPDALAPRMLDLAKVSAKDTVIDLGSGDGRLVIMAAQRGAKALGIEYDSKLVAYAKAAAAKAGVADRAQFIKADLFESDLSAATVITLFLGTDINRKLMPRLLDLKPGTRIVSNTHAVGDWPPDGTVSSADDEKTQYYRTALLWIVPAKVAGSWRLAEGSANFTQRFQRVSGSFTVRGEFAPLSRVTLRGDQLSFTAGGIHYSATVTGDTMTGVAKSGGASREWRATRIKTM